MVRPGATGPALRGPDPGVTLAAADTSWGESPPPRARCSSEGEARRLDRLQPDGSLIAAAAVERGTDIRDVRQPLEGHTGRITLPEFSPDGHTLVTGRRGRQSPHAIGAISFDLSLEGWKRHACLLAGRDLGPRDYRRLATRKRPVTAPADAAVHRPHRAVADLKGAEMFSVDYRRRLATALAGAALGSAVAVSGAPAHYGAQGDAPYVAPPPSSIAASAAEDYQELRSADAVDAARAAGDAPNEATTPQTGSYPVAKGYQDLRRADTRDQAEGHDPKPVADSPSAVSEPYGFDLASAAMGAVAAAALSLVLVASLGPRRHGGRRPASA